MFRQKVEGLSVTNNNDEDYLRRYGFSSEDLSFLISPLATTSPIKKKQRSIFTFEDYDEQSDEDNDGKCTPTRVNYDDSANCTTAMANSDMLPTIDENDLQKSFQEFALGSSNDGDDGDDDGLLDQLSSTLVEFDLISPTNTSNSPPPQSSPDITYSGSIIQLKLPEHRMADNRVFESSLKAEESSCTTANNNRDFQEGSMMDVALHDNIHSHSTNCISGSGYNSTLSMHDNSLSSSGNGGHQIYQEHTTQLKSSNLVIDSLGIMAFTSNMAASSAASPAISKEPVSSAGRISSVVDSAAAAAKDDNSARSAKSLATISRKFVEFFGQTRTIEYIAGLLPIDGMQDAPLTANRVDGTADALGVHVRRIYELIKILETLSLVDFASDERGKFTWVGTRFFVVTLGSIQADAIQRYPDVADGHGLKLMGSPTHSLTASLDGGMSNGSSPQHRPNSPDTLSSSVDAHAQRSPLSSSLLAGQGSFYDYPNLFDGDTADCLDDFFGDELLGHPYQALEVIVDPPGSGKAGGGSQRGKAKSKSKADTSSTPPDPVTRVNKKRAAVKKSSKSTTQPRETSSYHAAEHEEFMVESICKSFLQIFLLGHDSLAMNYIIQKLIPMSINQTLSEYNKANATKIRRVYDVANVLCSLNLIRKVACTATNSTVHRGRVPNCDATDNSEPARPTNSSTLGSTNNNGEVGRTLVSNGSNNRLRLQEGVISSGKADSKVLEWSSFPPTVIRDYYLRKCN